MTDSVLRWIAHTALKRDPVPMPDAAEWSASIETLSANRLSVLAGWLLGPRLSDMTNDVHGAIGRAQAKAMFATERCGMQLRELSPALERQNISWVILKGLPLAERLYPDPVCRPSRDLDLLVEPGQMERVGSTLAQLGYQVENKRHSTYHRRYLRAGATGWEDVVELHWRTNPPFRRSVPTTEVLNTRRLVDTRWGAVWIPDPDVELDHLVQHYIRHAGWQLILLLDILLVLRGKPAVTHNLGALLVDDQRRLGLEPSITGPFRLRQLPLQRWLNRHGFENRRTARRAAPIAVALAQEQSVGSWFSMLRGLVWPRTPSFRWQAMSATPWGKRTWRWYRLVTLGRGARHP